MPGGKIDILINPDFDGFDGKLRSGLSGAGKIASTLGKGLGLAIAAGTGIAAVGLKSVLDIGIEYTSQLNTLQSVTQATGVQMTQVGNLAKQLGADMTLPATSAADAAAAMTELAKGGLSVNEAMTAAKGTLQLAAAAQVDAARAAEIQSDALNQFGLSADKAGHVADVLANTANAASGEITDMASALKFVGPVARGLSIDIDNTATAIGLLAVAGIRGEQAGTSLRGIIASLASPSKPAAEALKTLGVVAFDTAGKFVGLRTFTDQLAQAKGRLSEADFAAAASTAFGNEGFTAANALAQAGAKAFDDMAVSVGRAGGASEVAAAKTKGLGGAWEGFKSQLETTGIEIFEAIDGPLEKLVRSGATFVDEFGGNVALGIERAVAAGEVFGPRLATAIKSRAQVVGSAISDVFRPITESSVGVLNTALNVGIGLWDDFTGVLSNAVNAARPVAQGIAAVARAATAADGPVSAVAAGIGLVGGAVRAASVLLVPLGKIVGAIASGFAALPGPIQSAVVALGLVAAFRGPLNSLGETVKSRVTEPFRNLSETIRLQQALLTGSTQIASQQVGKLGLAFSALEKNVPVIGRMADSFRGAAESARGFVANQVTMAQVASGISGSFTGLTTVLGDNEGRLRSFAGAAAGATAAIGTGLKSAASGLVGVLGGPWGAAIAAAGVGLSLYASAQDRAARETQKHTSSVQSLADALRESNGLITASVRETKAKDIADNYKDAAEAAKRFNITQEELVSAALKQGDAYDVVKAKLQDIIKANTTYSQGAGASSGQTIGRLNDTGIAASRLLGTMQDLAGDTDAARQKNDDLARAVKDGRASMLDSTESGRTLAGAMKTLASNTADADSRARALKDAIEALSGGNISLEAAQSRVQESLSRINETFRLTGDEAQDASLKAKGWGDSLLNAQGGLNLTTENGRRLRDMLQDLTTNTAEAASKTFDLARAQGDSVPVAAGKARQAMQDARDAFIGAAQAAGIGAKEAGILADKAGLIPDNVAMVISTPGSDQAKIELALVKSLVDKVPADKPITVRTLSEEAERKLRELGFIVTHMPDGTVQIKANTDTAQAQLNSYINNNSNRSITIPVRYTSSGIPAAGPGQLQANFARGGIAKAYASGGFEQRLTPMRGGLAAIVPPNTWRIVGDRLRDDEAYIPINRSTRSVSLLNETAQRMGYALARRYAQGGIASSGPTPAGITTSMLDGMRITGAMTVNGLDAMIDGRIEVADSRTAQAIANRRAF
jgi:TP901 family phage tail tape measure protein